MSLDQHARAGLQLLGSLQVFSSTALLERAESDFDQHAVASDLSSQTQQAVKDEDWPERLDTIRDVAERSLAYRFNRFYQRYVAEENWVRSIVGVERRRDQYAQPRSAESPTVHPRLQLDPTLEEPDYYAGVEWHLQPGGLDSYDLSGPMAFAGFIPHVFSRGGFAAVAVGDDLLEQRRQVIAQFRKDRYQRIYDPGCGGAGTLGLCRQRFPEAELVGGDLSAKVLRNGLAFSEQRGWDIEFRQEDARKTGEPDNAVDGVISYALHHELPAVVSIDVLKEMFRILAPGGDIVISDPPPFRAVSPFRAGLLAWERDNRAEPYFIEACMLNLAAVLTDIGFVDVEEYALQETGYPWVTRATKPDSSSQQTGSA
ncbi:MAG: class I SAM-dependent methyltransferase [Pseudomonadota bacterium]